MNTHVHAFVRVRTLRLLCVTIAILAAVVLGEAVLLTLVAKGGL